MRLVIVGNGIAGVEAARVARRHAPAAQITVLSEESDHLIARTALMYVLSGQLRHADIEPHERDLYQRERLERVRARATGIDLAARQVQLRQGPPLPYDRLLLATGSRPRRAPWPGADLRGVGHFVTLQDLAWLEAELHGASPSAPPRPDAHLPTDPDSPYAPREVRRARRGPPQHPVVVGGGLIGIEVVETLLSAGLRPRFLVREEWFWPVALERREAVFVAEHLAAHGVDVELGAEVQALLGDERGDVRAVRTASGERPCDLAVVAIGVTPNTGWLAKSGLELDPNGGVVVDTALRSSDAQVFAAGDCASVPQPGGGRAVEPLWYTARAQGRIAGAGLAGRSGTYARGVPFNSAKFMDLEYTTAGRVQPPAPGERDWFFREPGPVRSTLRLCLSGGHLVGMNAIGRRWNHAVFCRWIAEERPLAWVLHHLDEARFDTELVPPLRVPAGHDGQKAE